MKVIRPIDVTDAILTSNVAEDDGAAYSVAATYALGDIVIDAVAHQKYESLIAANTGNPLTDAAKWLELGATNRWRMFDQSIGTLTTKSTAIDVTVEASGRADGIALFGLDAETVKVVVYDPAQPLTNILLRSQEFDNATWTKEGAGASAAPTITANNVAAPDGTMTAEKIDFPAVAGTDRSILHQGAVSLGAVANSTSVYLKGAVGGEIIWLSWTPDGVTYLRQQCTLTTAWERFTLVGTPAAASQYTILGVDLRDTGQSASAAQTVYAWQMQNVPGSYTDGGPVIPTTTVPATGGTPVYNETHSLRSESGIDSWFEYFTEEIIYQTELVLTDLPLTSNVSVQAVVDSAAGPVEVGTLVVGQTRDIGASVYGARGGIVDYSRKTTDAFGNTSLVERAFAKRTSFKVQVEAGAADAVFALLALYRATPVVWVGTDSYNMTWIYGWARDWNVELSFPSHSYLSIEIEGLT